MMHQTSGKRVPRWVSCLGRLGQRHGPRWLLTVCALLAAGSGVAEVRAQYFPQDGGPLVEAPAQAPPADPLQIQPMPPEMLKSPKPVEQPGIPEVYMPNTNCMPGQAGQACQPGLVNTPSPSPEELAEYNKFVKEIIDPKNTLNMVVGRTRVLVLSEPTKRIQIGDEKVAGYTLLSPKELVVLGQAVGSTVLNLWFPDPANKDKDRVLSYVVNVSPDPAARGLLERKYKALTEEINRAFPDSRVCLFLIGDKLAVSGQARDVADAAHILRIARANTPKGDVKKLPADNVQMVLNPAAPGAAAGVQDLLQAGGPDVINLMRIPGEQQVMLKVTVAEVNRAAARSIGLNFNINNRSGVTVFGNNTGNIATGGAAGIGAGSTGFGVGTTGVGGTAFGGISPLTGVGASLNPFGLLTDNLPAVLDNGRIMLAINALRNLNFARSLAEPTLVALNGQTARFLAGGQFPVPVTTGTTLTGLQGVSFVPFGVQLTFTPYITDRDRVRLAVLATVSTRDLSSGTTISGSAVSGLSTRTFLTTVELREGQTLAVAGLIQNNYGANATRVPFFGDLPWIGRLAAYDQAFSGEQELVVLITPELVHPMEPHEVPPLPGSDLFEPGDLEFYLLGRLESRRNYDYRSSVMTDICRMCRYRHCEQIYIFGPHGHSDTPDASVVPGAP